jgi:hypothetical protein
MCVTCLIMGRRWYCCGKGIQMYRYLSCSSLIFLGIVMCVTCLITGRRCYCCGKGQYQRRSVIKQVTRMTIPKYIRLLQLM